MTYEHAVVLLPGFFGFGRLGNFYYFADRAAAIVRGAAEKSLGTKVPVMGVATRPVGSLVERQAFLLDRLRMVDRTLEARNYHLVGHSTGGVDAVLLRAALPLQKGLSWAEADPSSLRARLRTITTISAPYYGTYLADSDLVGFLQHPAERWRGLPDAANALFQLTKLAASREDVRNAFYGSLQISSGAGHFLWDVLTDRRLLADLATASAGAVQAAQQEPDLQIPVTCFVSTTPDEPLQDAAGEVRKWDDFFELLREKTAAVSSPVPHEIEKNVERLGTRDYPVIRNPLAELPTFTPSINDGIVNSASQILLAPGARLGGVVLGDHGDVIGHYDRVDPLTDGKPINDGFFRSGAGFGDDQFFDLWGQVAQALQATF